MKAVLCPVCLGKGMVNLDPVGTGANLKDCHGCGGYGWVTVPENSSWGVGDYSLYPWMKPLPRKQDYFYPLSSGDAIKS